MKKHWIFSLTQALENARFAKTIRGGLVMIIPILMIGAFALIGRTLPVPGYVDFITTFGGGFIYDIFDMAYSATFSTLSIYMTIAISIQYRRTRVEYTKSHFGPTVAALMCFFVLAGVLSSGMTTAAFGPKGMTVAIISGYGAPAIYCRIASAMGKKGKRLYSDGADSLFNSSIAVIAPAIFTTLIFIAVNTIVRELFNVTAFYDLLAKATQYVFTKVGRNFFGGLLFVTMSGLLWFFGIHGSDCLESVMEHLFTPAISINSALAASGGVPTEILTRQFIEIFVLMGGCGTAMCLLLSLLIFSRRKSSRHLSVISFFPMLFNINETMIFGLPVILHPIMFIPFLLTPIVCYIISYCAMALSLVPLTISTVEWTTPVLIGGYAATGSIAGSVLQFVCLVVGVAIYAPFVKLLDKHAELTNKSNYENLVKYYKEHEQDGEEISLISLENELGGVAKQLSMDLIAALFEDKLMIFYQPQYRPDGQCIGAEALLRWKHNQFGMVYPPLVIEIARETNMLNRLEQNVIENVLNDRAQLNTALGEDIVISLNVTGDTVTDERFLPFLHENESRLSGLCFEVTEQTALRFDDLTVRTLSEMREMGILLAIDDFSMGQTSVNYLKDKHFDEVKLDGALVKGMLSNPNCAEILSSIISLGKALGLSVTAEFVETAAQRDALEAMGCYRYQGYLYSPALPLSELNGKSVVAAKKQ